MKHDTQIHLETATSSEKSRFRRALLKWFDASQRDLPWRENRTPYRIWVSEIMLQQTQVATVVAYYQRFMKRFPTVNKLAKAEQSEVLKLWEGLGYYRRARQLHAAAQVVADQYGGKFPTEFDSVIALPGIGRYTAGAILSISLDQPHPILEGNTVRLFARLMKLRQDPKSSASQKQLWSFSESLVPRKRAGDFNQALMELGSEICKPNSPNCPDCPVIKYCPTFAGSLQEQIPASSKKMKYENLHEAVILIPRSTANKSNIKYLVRLCGEDERWTGLWDFPRFEMGEHSDDLIQKVQELTNLEVILSPRQARLKHAVTKYRITLDVYRSLEFKGRLSKRKDATLKWATLEELGSLPMSTTGRKIVNQCCK